MHPDAADENLATHMSWVQARLPGAHVEVGPELVLSDSGLPCDSFNFVCRARLPPARVAAAVRHVREHFGGVRRPFSWWVGPADTPPALGDALLEAGFAAAESEVAMAAALDRLAAVELEPDGLRIVRATTPAQVADFARINAANWSPPDPWVLRFYELATPLLLRPDAPLRLYVGYLDGIAVATAELTVADGAVGLYNISTLESHRRRGYGTALTVRPLVDARAEGHRLAVLQASREGQGVYAKVGFGEVGRYTEYKRESVNGNR